MRRQELKRKPMQKQFYWDHERPSVDKEKSLMWLYKTAQGKKWRV
jgi:hypothetical protein